MAWETALPWLSMHLPNHRLWTGHTWIFICWNFKTLFLNITRKAYIMWAHNPIMHRRSFSTTCWRPKSLAFVEGNKYPWLKNLQDNNNCWGCHILDRRSSSLSFFWYDCIKPDDKQFRKIDACGKCAQSGVMLWRRDHCYKCQDKLKGHLAESERRSWGSFLAWKKWAQLMFRKFVWVDASKYGANIGQRAMLSTKITPLSTRRCRTWGKNDAVLQ